MSEQNKVLVVNNCTNLNEKIQSGDAFAVYVQDAEWQCLLRGGGNQMLRSFRTRNNELLVLLRREDGHYVVGALEIGEVIKYDKLPQATADAVRHMYSQVYIQGLRRSSSGIYNWKVTQVEVFQEKVLLRQTTRFKNRTFSLTPQMLQTSRIEGPSSQCLMETARFFCEQLMSPNDRQALKFVARQLDNKCIRVGSTCSGSDICITTLEKTIAFLNSTEVGVAETCLFYVCKSWAECSYNIYTYWVET